MTVLVANNAYGTLAANLAVDATSLTLGAGDGARFPNPTAGDFFYATLVSGGSYEIIACLGRSGDAFTSIARGQDGTSALAFVAGSTVEIRPVRGHFTPSAIGAVAKTGDTMTGFLTMPADPLNPLQVATKQYVDAHINDTTAAHAATAVGFSGSGFGATDVTGALVELNTTKMPYTGGVFTGSLGMVSGIPPGVGYPYFFFAANGGVGSTGDGANVSSNIYFSSASGGWVSATTGYVARYEITAGAHNFYVSPSQAANAGVPITWRAPVQINTAGSVVIPVQAATGPTLNTSGSRVTVPAGGVVAVQCGSGLVVMYASGTDIGTCVALYLVEANPVYGVAEAIYGRFMIVGQIGTGFGLGTDATDVIPTVPAGKVGLEIQAALHTQSIRFRNNTTNDVTVYSALFRVA